MVGGVEEKLTQHRFSNGSQVLLRASPQSKFIVGSLLLTQMASWPLHFQ